MGLLVKGQWKDQWYDTKSTGGKFVRQDSAFRDQLTTETTGHFVAEPGRYHLYVSLACPWAHRTLIARTLKGLKEVLPLSIVDPLMREQGWRFTEELPDHCNGLQYLHQLYTRARTDYTGRVTVPVLWDTQRQTIVNNESAEILRQLNRAFDRWGRADVDLCPDIHREEIDEINRFVYDRINNGVYKCGFATEQAVYEENLHRLFDALDDLEQRLGGRSYLVGSQPTEADWRLFTTLIRFDAVYVGHFKCNLRRLADYPRLQAYLQRLYAVPGVADTVNMDHIKRHYYVSHTTINPTGIVPVGPELPFLTD